MDELAQWDGVETAERISKGDVSAKEVLEAALKRAEAQRELGAFVTPTFDRARGMVGATRGPFAGVPSAIKDLAQVEGIPTSFGSRGGAKTPAAKSDPWVRTFEGLGFVSLGKTATPELGLTATTESVGFAPCRNPWDRTRSTGGSSGGAAALVSSGVVPLAHASDGGGSIRIPAAACGLVGLKPTRGRFDMEGSNLLPVNVAVHGAVTRTVRDTIAFWDGVSKTNPRKGMPSMIPDVRSSAAKAPAAALRIGFYTATPKGTPVQADYVQAVKDIAKKLESLGHRVTEIDNPVDAQFADDFTRYWGFVAYAQSRTMSRLAQKGFDKTQLDPWTEGLAMHFWKARRKGLASLWRLRSFHTRFLTNFDRHDVLLSPVLAHTPPVLGHLAPEVEWNTQLQRLTEWVPYTQCYNVSGAPAISLPLAKDANGLPIGLQFGANRGQERTLLELALQLEEAMPWQRVAPTK